MTVPAPSPAAPPHDLALYGALWALAFAHTPDLREGKMIGSPALFIGRRMAACVLGAYRAPFAPPRNRDPLHIFPRHILASRDWLATFWADLQGWHGPAALIWPENDIAFRARELARWRALWPDAPVRTIPRCGHFLWEDAPADSIAALRKLLADRRTRLAP